jgi:F0F1-type ATP synthase beta subunit
MLLSRLSRFRGATVVLDLPRRGSAAAEVEAALGASPCALQVEDTVKSFKAVVDGEYDHLPEAAFYMVGGIEEAVAKAAKMAAEAA